MLAEHAYNTDLITFRCLAVTERQLRDLAERRGQKRSALVRELVTAALRKEAEKPQMAAASA